MAEKSTFIKLDRNILNWRWYQDANTFRVFIHLLLKANIDTNGFMGIDIHRGELATSYESVANTLNLTVGMVRTAIQHLKSTGEITVKRHPKFQVISVVNYDLYQSKLTVKTAGKQQSSNNQVTIEQQQSKNIRNKEIKNIDAAFAQNKKWDGTSGRTGF